VERKCGTRVDFQGYEEWQTSRAQSTLASTSAELQTNPGALETQSENDLNVNATVSSSSLSDDAPTPATFAEICEMIAQGKPIPGIKEIPDTILEGQGTHTSASQRKKPWEKEGAVSSKPSWQS